MRLTALLAGAVAITAATAPLAAQTPTSGAVMQVTPYAGYMISGSFANGPLGTSISNAPALMYGAQVGLKIAPNVSLVGNLAQSNSSIQVGVPILGGLDMGTSNLTLYDADLQLDLPRSAMAGMPLGLFVQAGAGGMHYAISETVVNTTATNVAGNVGLGADVTLGSGFGMRVMAKDYFGKFNFQDATGLNVNGNVMQNWALSAGLRFDF